MSSNSNSTPKSIEDARKLSTTALNKLSKNELIKLINKEPSAVSTVRSDVTKTDSATVSVSNSSITSIDDFNKFFTKKLADLESAWARRIEDLESTVQSQGITISNYTKRINELETKVANKEAMSRRKNFIIKGVQDNIELMPAVKKVINAIDPLANTSSVKSAFRIGNVVDGRPRLIMVKATRDFSFKMVSNGKKLRNAGDSFKGVYVDRDLPPETAKAVGLLRKRAYDYRIAHPGEPAYVKGGKLYINNVLADEVSLK